jgi:hypothetical protein
MNETSFEKEFNEFIRKIDGAEIISGLGLKIPEGSKIADYFLENRKVIGELKCLEVDTGVNLQRLVDEAIERGEILFYGRLPFNQVIDNLPLEQKERLKKQAFESVTSSFETAFEQANRQIRDTKNVCNLKESAGFVILFNSENITLDPKSVIYKLNYLMNKERDGKIRYESLNFGVYISTRHYTNIREHQKIFPIIYFTNNKLRELTVEESNFVLDFMKLYSAYKGVPIYLPKDLKIQEAAEFPYQAE